MTDIYGRTVSMVTSDGQDIYSVISGGVVIFTVAVTTGHPTDDVMTTINAMAPDTEGGQ